MTAVPRSGEGTIARGTAYGLTASFLTLIALPVAWQAADSRGFGPLLAPFRDEVRAEGFQGALRLFEKRVEDKGALQEAVRRPYRELVFRTLGRSAENTCPGRDGFLYYRDDLVFQWGPGPASTRTAGRLAEVRDRRPDAFEEAVRGALRRLRRLTDTAPAAPAPYVDARTMILDTVRQLEARGLRVLVVPLPGKAAIYPEYFAPSYPLATGPAINRDLLAWEETIRAEGVPFVDTFGPMWAARQHSKGLLYLPTDSHWSPEGLAVTADAIAAAASEILGPAPTSPFTGTALDYDFRGDQEFILDMDDPQRFFPLEPITVTKVSPTSGDDVSGNDAPVLLLGDSFTTIFRDHEAGLAAQLRLRLGRGVQEIAWQGITPAALMRLVAGRPEALAKKKLVIWTFVDRTVNTPKSWEIVSLVEGGKR